MLQKSNGIRLIVCCLLFVLCIAWGAPVRASSSQGAQDDTPVPFILNVTTSGYPPFLVHEPAGGYSGILVEVMRHVAREAGVPLAFAQIPRKRVDRMLASGDIHATGRAREWTPDAEAFRFSEPIMPITDTIFTRTDADLTVTSVTDLFGMRVGTVLGYVYPRLDPIFEADLAYRQDALEESMLLRSLWVGRLDAIVAGEPVINWLVQQNPDYAGTFVRQPLNLSTVDYRFLLSPHAPIDVTTFNAVIARLRASGELAAIIARYQ